MQVRAPSFGGRLFPHLRRTARVCGGSFGTRIACSRPPPHNVSILQPQCVTNALRFLGHFLRPQEVAVRFPAAPTFRRAISFLSMRRHRRRRSCPHLALRVASPVGQGKPASRRSAPRSSTGTRSSSPRAGIDGTIISFRRRPHSNVLRSTNSPASRRRGSHGVSC